MNVSLEIDHLTGEILESYVDDAVWQDILHKFLVATDLVKLKAKPELCRGLRRMVMRGIQIHAEGILREESRETIHTKVREDCDTITLSLRLPSECNIVQSLDVISYLEKGGKTSRKVAKKVLV